MGFMLGFFMGLISAIGMLGFLSYWLCRRTKMNVATFIGGIAQALSHEPKPAEASAPDTNGVETDESTGDPKRRQGCNRP